MKKIIFLIFTVLIFGTSLAYNDINESHWAYKEIENLKEEGIILGYPDGNFYPDKNITYGEFFSILIKTIGSNADVSADSGHWADEYIITAEKKGILNKKEYSIFCPDKQITRREVAKALVNSFERSKNAYLEGNKLNNIFIDIDVENHEDTRIAQILSETGILSGYPDRSVRFNELLTRAELCSLIINFKENMGKLKHFNEKQEVIYREEVAVFDKTQMYTDLQPLSFMSDYEYITTKIENIEFFIFEKGYDGRYKEVISQLYADDNPYSEYRRNIGNGEKVIAVRFSTINNSDKYDIFSGYRYLHLSFPQNPEIFITDAFDNEEINSQIKGEVEVATILKPKEKHTTTAFYIVNEWPKEEIRFDRAATTLYDEENKEFKEVKSFRAAVFKL